MAVSGKLEGTKYSNDHRATFTNCYETIKSDYSSPGITTISEEKLKSGEIAYKLNGNQSDGTWGQVIGTEDYPHFRKYSKTVYYDPATQTYSNNKAASITSAAVTDIKTISETKATATLKATGTPGAEVKFLLTSGEDEQTGTLDDMFSKGRILTESSSGNYEYTIEDLAPDTEYLVRLMIKKDGELSLDVTYVNFQTEKVQQEAPKAADVSINYEQETLENKASCDLEYAASKDAQSWTTIRQGGMVRLTWLLDNIRESGGSVPVYIRKKASSSMSASEAVLVADLQTQTIPEESNKPNIDYRKEEITISSSLQYVIVNGTNTSPSWTSAKMGSGSGISITDIISSDHESTVYYRYAASNTDKKFAGKPERITILKRTAAPAAITEGEVDITGTTITINRTNPENDIEYGYRDADSDGAFTWIDGTEIQGLYPAHGYQVTSRIKAKENAFASERTEPLNVSTKDTLRIVGNGTPKWDAKGTYGVSLAQIPVSLASGYGVYNGANQLVAGTWSWEPENSSSASGIYPKVEDNKAYTVKFTPTDSSASYDRTLTDSVVPEISKYPLKFSVAVKDKTYDGTTNADISSVTFEGSVTLQKDKDYTVTARFDDASVGNGKNITATVTLMEQTTKNYALKQSSFTTTGNITKAAVPDFTKETALTIVNGHEKTYTVALPALPTLETPKEYGALTYEIGEIKLNDGYYTSGAKVENGELTLPIQKNDVETTGSVGTVTVVIKSTNYEDITLTVNVNATNKLVPTVTAPTANALTYNGAEQALVTAGKTTGGTMLYRLDDSEWSEQIPTAKNAGEYTVWYKVQGNAEYADVAEQNVTVIVAKKSVTVTALDKSAYTGSTAPDLSSPEADKDYKVEGLVGADTLSGTVTLTYAQTPDMSKPGKTAINIAGTLSNDNYEITYVPGTLTVSNQPSSGGGSSSGGSSSGGGSSSSDRDTSSSGTVKTETTKNNDGSVTKTETKKDGTKVETTTGKDGSVTKTETKTETKPDGTKVETKTETITSKDGTKSETKSETKTDKNGVTSGTETTKTTTANGSTGTTVTTTENGESKTEAVAKVSDKAIEDAKKSGEAVKAPVEVEASRDSNTAPTVKVELPKNSGDTKVEIPVSNVKPGTVAVLVHADGTEEIVKNSLPTEDGIQLTVNGGATVKIVDNSKNFADTRNHWAKDAIDFVSARGLVNGMSTTIYAPNASTTRAQLWTILARQNDADLTGGSIWYEKAQNWAKEKGISDGMNPNGTINRAQMVTMLWRAMGQPAAASGASFADVPADSYYAQAVAWAIENGITAGVGGGRFDPNSTCTRGQIATFLWRAMAE